MGKKHKDGCWPAMVQWTKDAQLVYAIHRLTLSLSLGKADRVLCFEPFCSLCFASRLGMRDMTLPHFTQHLILPFPSHTLGISHLHQR